VRKEMGISLHGGVLDAQRGGGKGTKALRSQSIGEVAQKIDHADLVDCTQWRAGPRR